MTDYPTINEPPEDPGGQTGGGWRDPEPWVRWAATVVYVAAMTGFATTIGGTVSPLAGWVVVAVGSGVAVFPLWGKHIERSDARERARRAARTSSAWGGNHVGPDARSLGIGPGTDADDGRYPWRAEGDSGDGMDHYER